MFMVTGGAGFIGSAFVRKAVQENIPVVVYDAITYAGDWARLENKVSDVFLVKGRIEDAERVRDTIVRHKVSTIINFAAESHVSRSLLSPAAFAMTDTVGTTALLHEAARCGVDRFVQISTDEVYGDVAYGCSDENSPLRPRNPYAASKAGADLMVMAAYATFGLPTLIIRPCNNYGPWQDPEKFVARACCRSIEGLPIFLYGDGKYVREWIYVEDCVEAILRIVQKAPPGDIYNVGSGFLSSVYEVAQKIREIARQHGFEPPPVEYKPLRPADDRRYAIDASKAASQGFLNTPISPDDGLRSTFQWYLSAETWWRTKAGWSEEVLDQ